MIPISRRPFLRLIKNASELFSPSDGFALIFFPATVTERVTLKPKATVSYTDYIYEKTRIVPYLFITAPLNPGLHTGNDILDELCFDFLDVVYPKL